MEPSDDADLQHTVVDGAFASTTAGVPPGRALGRYLVIDEIGAGGMGRVFRAYDPKLGREVALKRLHLREGKSSGDDGARMLREAKAMAQLAHPNVVSVFDVDVDRGSVFIAMEFVDGATLQAWLAQRERTPGEIVEQFVQAGRGLAAAHAQGIVHRDFKPSNVVIGADGRSRVMDFGLARAAGDAPERIAAATDDSGGIEPTTPSPGLGGTLTARGTVVGTPPYMAPEQHLGASIDARTDQYAFCVALWEALFRRAPFVGNDIATIAAAKLAGPPRPPAGVRVPARLQAILFRGLAVDPAQRWPDMNALIAALQRGGAARRWRWPLVVGTAGAVLVAAMWVRADGRCEGGEDELAEVWGPGTRAQIERALAESGAGYGESVAARVGDTLDVYAATWVSMHRDACEATEVRHEQSDEALDLRMGCLRARARELGDVVTLLAEVDEHVAREAIELASALTPVGRCSDVAALRERVPPPDRAEVRDAVERLREELDAARLQLRAGRPDAAHSLAEAVHAEAKRLEYPPIAAEAEVGLARTLAALGRSDDARPLLESALDTALAGRNLHTAAAAAAGLNQVLVRATGDVEESQWLARMALGLAEADGSDPRLIAQAMLAYGEVFAERELELEAEPYYAGAVQRLEETLGPDHPDLIGPLLDNADLMRALSRRPEAEALARRALAIAESVYGLDHPEVAEAHKDLGWDALVDGRAQEALEHFDRSLALFEAAYGPDHGEVWAALGIRSAALSDLHRYDEAIEGIEESLRRMERTVPPGHSARASSLHNLANVHAAKGDHARAVATAREVILLRRAIGHRGPLAAGLVMLGRELGELGEYDEAETVLGEAVRVAADSHADDGLYSPGPDIALADVVARRGDPTRARGILERVLDRADPERDAIDIAQARWVLGQALWAQAADRRRAVALVEEAAETFAKRPSSAVEVERMRAWLDQHTIDDPETVLVAGPHADRP